MHLSARHHDFFVFNASRAAAWEVYWIFVVSVTSSVESIFIKKHLVYIYCRKGRQAQECPKFHCISLWIICGHFDLCRAGNDFVGYLGSFYSTHVYERFMLLRGYRSVRSILYVSLIFRVQMGRKAGVQVMHCSHALSFIPRSANILE
jgi:hypothetical protein